MTALQQRFGRRIAVITAVALLFAQLGAMRHAYSHDSAKGPASSVQSGLISHDFCSDCLAYAPLLSATGAPAALPAIAPQDRSPLAIAVGRSLVDLSLTLAFRSRAPPAAL